MWQKLKIQVRKWLSWLCSILNRLKFSSHKTDKKRIATHATRVAVRKQLELQSNLFNVQFSLQKKQRFIDIIGRQGFKKTINLADGRVAIYHIFVESDFGKQEAGEEVMINNPALDKYDAWLNRWEIKLVQNKRNLDFLFVNYGGMAVWFFGDDSSISSYCSDEYANRYLIEACELLDTVRQAAQPLKNIEKISH